MPIPYNLSGTHTTTQNIVQYNTLRVTRRTGTDHPPVTIMGQTDLSRGNELNLFILITAACEHFSYFMYHIVFYGIVFVLFCNF